MKSNLLRHLKGILAVAITLVLALPVAGCGQSAPTQQQDTTQDAPAAADVETDASSSAPADEEQVSLSSWTEGSASLKALTDYVEEVTDESSPNYIPPEDRIVVSDLDGTLMCETFPWCFEYMVFADYVMNNPDYEAPDDIMMVATEIVESAWGEKPSGMSTRQAAAAAIAYEGLTPEELEAYVTGFKSSPAEGYKGMTRGEAWFVPMVEIIKYLQANDFEVYVVTATERNIVRAVVDGTLDVDPAHVIGTEYGYKATGQGDEEATDYTFKEGDQVVFDGSYEGENAKMSKVDAIVREIGKQPVIALGNSSGDEAMLAYVLSQNKYPSMSFMVLDDDEVRDYGNAEEAAEKRAGWEESGFTVFSMRDDFATIYGEGVEKDPQQ